MASSIGGTFYLHSASNPTIVNTIIEGTLNGGGIYKTGSSSASFTYCDFYNNAGGNLVGIPFPGFEELVTVNANGDSCDTYMNIFEDPLFVDPTAGDYHLLEDSPCIDAGAPNSPPDPDGTVADIGVFYFDQGSGSPLTVTLTPHGAPIQIPAGGGSFQYDILIENTTTTGLNADVWIEAVLPNGSNYPILLRENIFFGAGASISRENLNQNIPPGAPAGNYSYVANVGVHPDSVMVSDSFPFEKLSGDGLPGPDTYWSLSGWESENAKFTSPEVLQLYPACPNPFNPTVSIGFYLSEGSVIELAVYDISGRRISTLVNGWCDMGFHQAVFDGTNMASGIYFYSLNTDGFKQTEKMILVK